MITKEFVEQLLRELRILADRWSEPYGADSWTKGYLLGRLGSIEVFSVRIDPDLIDQIQTMRAHIESLPPRGVDQ